MAAATADRPRKKRGTPIAAVRVGVAASTVIYAGTFVNRNSSGYLVSATDASGEDCLGVAAQHVDNSSGSNGDLDCLVEFGQIDTFEKESGITIADLGKRLVISDNQTVSDAATETNDVGCGTLVGITADGKAEVLVGIGYARTA